MVAQTGHRDVTQILYKTNRLQIDSINTTLHLRKEMYVGFDRYESVYPMQDNNHVYRLQ